MSFVIMRRGFHAYAIVIPTPVAIRPTRKACNEYIKSKRNPNEYYIRKVKDAIHIAEVKP